MALRIAKAVAIAGVSATLCGCGGGETTEAPTPKPAPAPVAPTPAPVAPTPAPVYNPDTVTKAWGNHFSAFATFDVPKIMKDYTEDSVLAIFNDKCDGQSPNNEGNMQGFTEHRGTQAIQGFFEGLFAQLKNSLADSETNVTGPDFTDPDNVGPLVVEDMGGEIAAANVFLTWTAAAANPVINWATDSFSFKKADGKFTIHKQNIVASDEVACAASQSKQGDTPTTIQDLTTLNGCGDTATGLCGAWNNHFKSFGGQNITTMMDDYTEASVVQIWDARTLARTEYKGLTKIREMFLQLFADLGGPPALGLDVKLLEVHEATKTVFLVWKSDAIPQATDFFIFDANDKIITQNIQVLSMAAMETAAMLF